MTSGMLREVAGAVSMTELADAIRSGDFARVKAMLEERAELAETTASYGDERRAIHYAVIHRRPEIARLLMRKGANARAGVHPHRDATSAWTLARERGYGEMVAIMEEEEARRARLAEESADASVDEPTGEPGRAAVANGDWEWLRGRLADGTLRNDVRWDDGGLLTVAVRSDRMDVLRFLLDAGFDPDEAVSYGGADWVARSQGYPLWHAAALDRNEMAGLLLDRGANSNAHVDSSGSAVYSAYSHRQWATVELLRARGGKVTADIAALYRETEVARQLLADDTAEDLLRFGADAGAVEIVRMAIPRIGWEREDERWFRMLAAPLSFWHHIPWLYAGNKEFDRTGYLACFRLIAEACDVRVTGSFGRSLLHEIAAMGDWVTDDEVTAFGRAALEAGARADGRDELLGSTPLGWACRWGRAGLVRLLLEAGADAEEREAEPWARPRAWAEKMGREEIVRLLG